jgi:hypothetical protein
VNVNDLWDWITERRYELILPAWTALTLLYFACRRLAPATTVRFYPGLIALALTPPAVTVLMWPGARWPTYRDAFFEPYYDVASIPPLHKGFSVLLFHVGYGACALIAAYAITAAFASGRVPLSRMWGYGSVLALYLIEELVFFRISVVE